MKAGGNAARSSDWPVDLFEPVSALPDHSRLWVAFSGGLDSALLLHVVAACHPDVTALHINHQLQNNHEQTEQFCRDTCAQLSVPLVVHRVDVGVTVTGGLEEAARRARYQVFKRQLGENDLLLMAHHGDDQAETVLFRLLRGSGVHGLAGMPRTRAIGPGRLFRPWLDISRERLAEVAGAAGLSWAEDPSNENPIFDRNYLRHAIVPGLKSRWPGLLKRVAYSARACRESEQLNQRLAEIQWQVCGDAGRLKLEPFRALAELEQRNLVRWWIRHQGWQAPALSDWGQALADMLAAGADREPEIRGDGFSLRRYREHLYLVPNESAPAQPVDLLPDYLLKWGRWQLQLRAERPGHTSSIPPPQIRISTRQGGERVRFAEGEHSRALKTWLQERGVPPWERAALPLVYRQGPGGSELIAIGDLWCSDQYSGSAPAAGWRLIVERDCD